MKTKIVIGCILTVCILMMVPSISAVQYTTVVETNRSQILQQLQSMTVNQLREKFEILKEKIKSQGNKGKISQTNLFPDYNFLSAIILVMTFIIYTITHPTAILFYILFLYEIIVSIVFPQGPF